MTDRMSIAMLSHVGSATAPTGAERSLGLLARGLHDAGHRVRVVAPKGWALASDLEAAGVETGIADCRPCWLAYWEPRPVAVAALKWLRFARPDPARAVLRRMLESLAPDVVHVNCLPHLGGAREASGLDLPVVWHLREILPPGRRRRWWATQLARYASRVVAVSEAVGAWVREERLGDRVEVVHNGIDPDESTTGPATARRALGLPLTADCVVGLVGQLRPHKGVFEFLRAARIALAGQPDLRFVLAGDGPGAYVEAIRREIAAAPQPDRFHLLPPQPRGTDVIAACDAVALTTVTPDPLPRTVLEAMAAGRPVAAFRSGGTAELVADRATGLLVDVGDVEGLGRAFAELAGDSTLRATLGDAGRRRAVEQFSPARHVSRMERILRGAAR